MMSCPACGRELPSAFPGATVTCACGRSVEIGPPPSRVSRPSAGGPMSAQTPYRSSGGVPEEARAAPCPYCGNTCPPLVRICPHCDVRLDNVRCGRCFSLQAPGAFACARCGQALELEPLLDATDAPCPRCSFPLDVAAENEMRLHECARCGGLFVPKDVLAEILCRAEVGGALPEIVSTAARAKALDEVRYLPCPLCHASMNRVNFGKVSGVIVDVCKAHGTWFDAGELTRVVAFAAGGGLDRMREREKKEKETARKESVEIHAGFVAMEAEQHVRARVGLWQEFLRAILFW